MQIHLRKHNYHIKDVLYILGLKMNLLYIDQILDHNLKVEFDILDGKKHDLIQDKYKYYHIVAHAVRVRKIFLFYIMAFNN